MSLTAPGTPSTSPATTRSSEPSSRRTWGIAAAKTSWYCGFVILSSAGRFTQSWNPSMCPSWGARGIMHEEMPRAPQDGHMEGFQLWVNLPAEPKMTKPRYQDVFAAAIPQVRREDGSLVRVVAGEVDGVPGAVSDIYAEPEYLDVSLPAGVGFVQSVPRGHAALAYAFEGEGRFGVGCDLGYRGDLDGELLAAPRMAIFGDGDEVRVRADDAAVRFLLVSGRPLGEPIARYGPFVMNAREELQIALQDLQNDAFVWRDDEEWARKRRTWSPRTWSRCGAEGAA